MKTIQYKAGYKYQLVNTYVVKTEIFPPKSIYSEYITLSDEGYLTIKKGYAWDGPSGPTIDTKNFMRGSLIHDALYQLMRECRLGHDQKHAADMELYRACREDGMNRFRARIVLWAMRFTDYATRPAAARPVITAP